MAIRKEKRFPLFSGETWNMQAYYRQHLTTQKPGQSQALGWLLCGQREEMGWEFQGLAPEILGPHLGNFFPQK